MLLDFQKQDKKLRALQRAQKRDTQVLFPNQYCTDCIVDEIKTLWFDLQLSFDWNQLFSGCDCASKPLVNKYCCKIDDHDVCCNIEGHDKETKGILTSIEINFSLSNN